MATRGRKKIIAKPAPRKSRAKPKKDLLNVKGAASILGITIEELVDGLRQAGMSVAFDAPGPRLIKQEADVDVRQQLADSFTAAQCAAIDQRMAGSIGTTHNATALERAKLPSAFQINAPVFLRYGDAFLPAIVIAVRFTESEVSYDLAPAGNIFGAIVPNIWSGYVSARDPEQQWSSTPSNEIPTASKRVTS